MEHECTNVSVCDWGDERRNNRARVMQAEGKSPGRESFV
jgi:hypothetical protein